MADKYFLSIIDEMDRLWYAQVILFSQPTPLLVSVAPKQQVENENHVDVLPINSESPSSSSSIFSLPPLLDEETTSSTDESPSPEMQLSSSNSIPLPLQVGSIEKREDEIKERLEGIRSHSSSPSSTQNHHRRRRRRLKKHAKLDKSMSCKTLGELELDEVKGFMDLGFVFKKEYICPRMMSVVPGLHRLRSDDDIEMVQGNNDIEEKRDIMRPYLSEAWLIKRPDSPLLSLKIPKPNSAEIMKKHLQSWAKFVASEIKQE